MASRSIICRSRRLRQIIDVRDTGKSRYFVITEFTNCFIIRSPCLFFNEYLREAKRSAFFHARTYHAWFRLRMSRVLFAAKHSWTTLSMSRPLFGGSYLQVKWWAFSQWKGRKICIEWQNKWYVLTCLLKAHSDPISRTIFHFENRGEALASTSHK